MSVRAESCHPSIPVQERPACGDSDRGAGRDGSERSRRLGCREPRLAHSESPPTFPETGLVILTFEHVDFCERHVFVSSSEATPRRRGWFLLDTVVPTASPGCSRQARPPARAWAEGAPSVHTGCFNAVASIGSFRRRLPVAAKTALVTAGTMAEVPVSPIPPGGSELWTMWTSTAGASFMRRIWYVSKLVCSTRPFLRVISP